MTDELLHIDVQNIADDHRYFPFEEVRHHTMHILPPVFVSSFVFPPNQDTVYPAPAITPRLAPLTVCVRQSRSGAGECDFGLLSGLVRAPPLGRAGAQATARTRVRRPGQTLITTQHCPLPHTVAVGELDLLSLSVKVGPTDLCPACRVGPGQGRVDPSVCHHALPWIHQLRRARVLHVRGARTGACPPTSFHRPSPRIVHQDGTPTPPDNLLTPPLRVSPSLLAPRQVYFVTRALWCKVWCKLNAIRSSPGHLLHLCKTFEDLLLRHHPRLFFHLLRCGVNPLQVRGDTILSAPL